MLVVLLSLSSWCLVIDILAIPCSAIGLSEVCDRDISRSYSLFLELCVQWTHFAFYSKLLQCVHFHFMFFSNKTYMHKVFERKCTFEDFFTL